MEEKKRGMIIAQLKLRERSGCISKRERSLLNVLETNNDMYIERFLEQNPDNYYLMNNVIE